jgi:hypothetical protein
MDEKKNMLKDEIKEDAVVTDPVTDVEDEDDGYVIKLKKPYKFEGKEYTEIDLSGLEDISARDMIAVNKYMDRNGGTGLSVMPEVSLEYACNLAARAAQLPVEFFLGLPGYVSMKVKNRVMGFLFGAE